MIDLENIPVCNSEEEHTKLCKQIIELGGIPIDKLEIGATYSGICRNSDQATWNGSEFEYDRYKFGTWYKDKIPHFQSEKHYDVFIPLSRISILK